jgi:hypothetical protein
MLYKLKEVKVLLSVLLVLTWLVGGSLGYFYYASNTKQLKERDTKVVQLNTQVKQIGELVTAYTVNADVKMGKKIEDTDLKPIQVPTSMATNLILDSSEIIGKYYKLSLTAGSAISKDAIYSSELTDDMRLYDVVLNNIPVGLKEGTYVDVRISLPLGEDFVAIPHKKVASINAGVLKLAINETDIHTYNSMLIDALLYPGTSMYAVEYLEGGVQKAADAYYPVSNNILSVAQKDPNLLDAIKSDIMQRRAVLETGLNQVARPKDSQRESLDLILQRGREKYQSTMTEASKQQVLEAEKAAAEAKVNGQAPPVPAKK